MEELPLQTKEELLSAALDNLMEASLEPHDIATGKIITALTQIIIALQMEEKTTE